MRPAVLSRLGLAAFIGLVALEHVVRPGLDPAERFISEYARGSTQPLAVAAFGTWAVATAAGVRLALAAPRDRPVARALTAAALVAAVAGLVLAALFTTQTIGGELPEGARRTTAGRLHDLGTLFILAGLLIAALASLRLVPGRRYRLTVLALAVALLGVVPVLVALGVDAPGIGQRAFIGVGVAWQWAFAGQGPAGSASRNRRRCRRKPL